MTLSVQGNQDLPFNPNLQAPHTTATEDAMIMTGAYNSNNSVFLDENGLALDYESLKKNWGDGSNGIACQSAKGNEEVFTFDSDGDHKPDRSVTYKKDANGNFVKSSESIMTNVDLNNDDLANDEVILSFNNSQDEISGIGIKNNNKMTTYQEISGNARIVDGKIVEKFDPNKEVQETEPADENSTLDYFGMGVKKAVDSTVEFNEKNNENNFNWAKNLWNNICEYWNNIYG